jgi:protein-S-isoprenylcysteine O-methyltransferase Ste14
MPTLRLKIPPPVVTLIAGAAMWGVDRASPALHFRVPGSRITAGVFAVLGLVLAGAAIAGFLRARTTILPEHPEKSSALVTTGIYRVTRNPMYLGLVTLMTGWAVLLSNPLTLAVVPLFALYLQRFQIVPEEEALARKFGASFEEYRRRVPRWL